MFHHPSQIGTGDILTDEGKITCATRDVAIAFVERLFYPLHMLSIAQEVLCLRRAGLNGLIDVGRWRRMSLGCATQKYGNIIHRCYLGV